MEPYTGFEPQVGEIRAVRTFRIGPGGVLYPLFSDLPWTDGPNTAVCRMVQLAGGAQPSHPVPQPDCSCGFYAYGSAPAAAEYPHARHVLAVVACWGRVIAGTRGLRAEHGRIEALWLADTVPAPLADAVALRYPSAVRYPDKATMLAEHPPTPLDCYELEPASPVALRRWAKAAVVVAVIGSALPMSWWDGLRYARPVWAAAFVLFVIAALLLARRRTADLAARRQRVLFQAVALWLVAPFAGPVGVLLLRLPLVQLGVLILLQRYQLTRDAGRFPADIG